MYMYLAFGIFLIFNKMLFVMIIGKILSYTHCVQFVAEKVMNIAFYTNIAFPTAFFTIVFAKIK